MQLATRQDVKELESRLQRKMRATGQRLLKWQWGIGLALTAIMARGFGWLGF